MKIKVLDWQRQDWLLEYSGWKTQQSYNSLSLYHHQGGEGGAEHNTGAPREWGLGGDVIYLVRHDADPAPGGGVEEDGAVVPEDVTGGGHVPSEDAGEVEERSLLHID